MPKRKRPKRRQRKRRVKRKQKSRSTQGFAWRSWPDEKLLDLRFRDLRVRVERTKLARYIRKLYEELETRGLLFRPHFWLSDEFFTPSGVPGTALPFYLAHPRLEKLEKKMISEVEGGNANEAMRILRHEAGHAIEHAFRLARRKDRREVFGSSTEDYPKSYAPRPFSRSFVTNLENGYGQSHPDEDFAETFAVWLTPNSNWRTKYSDWPAIKKLDYIDRLMGELRGKRPPVRTDMKYENLPSLKKTLRQHYEEKRERFGLNFSPSIYDRDLRRLFSDAREYRRNMSAVRFIQAHRKEVREKVSEWTGQYHYTVDEVLEKIIGRCRVLKLRLTLRESETEQEFMIFMTVQTMNYLHQGKYRFAL